MDKDSLKDPSYIYTQQLTSSFVAVPIPEDLVFNTYLFDTQDGSDFYYKINEDDDHSFLFSRDRNTLPFNSTFNKRKDDKISILFYAKGTGVLQIFFAKG